MALKCLGLLTALLLLAVPASAKGQPGFVLVDSQTDQQVEQQPGVVNPGTCIWDVDDHWDYTAFYGQSVPLEPGASVQVSKCLILDSPSAGHRHTSLNVSSPSPLLTVEVAFSPGQSYVIPAVANGNHSYRYCERIEAPAYFQSDPLAQVIPDSNGGWGVPTIAAMSITNTSSHAVKLSAQAHFGWTAGC